MAKSIVFGVLRPCLVYMVGGLVLSVICHLSLIVKYFVNIKLNQNKVLPTSHKLAAPMTSSKSPLQFVPVSSFIQSSFWNKLSALKIEIDKLDESDRPIWGYFSNVATTWKSPVLEVDSTSFNATFDGVNNSVPFHGHISNKNTIEQFKDCNKNDLINEEAKRFWGYLKDGLVLEKPSMLNFFLVLSFSDLKKYHFYYWFAFPVPHNLQIEVENFTSISNQFTDEELGELSKAYLQLDVHQKPYFIIHNKEIHTLNSIIKKITEDNYEKYYFVFNDFKTTSDYPKSQLKNFIILLLYYCPFLAGKKSNFILWTLDRKFSVHQSVIFELILPECDSSLENITYVGWEKNENNKFGPRFSNMKATMDPKVLFEESVDLNLKLMKWRLLPNIDLEKIKTTKCLLLGSGTLGCSVARTLLGWGVRNITFVDNSTVSFSNPVRQSLFTYEDSIQSKPKAEAAADSLRKIFPGINSKAHQFTIPMPGHCIGPNTIQPVQKNVAQLNELITQHDIIFLLTDSRESRWLPTLLATFHHKTIINVALGFDSYLVMRYGSSQETCPSLSETSGFKSIPGTELGCYFCNDVTAPGNSLKDRTLDQQCTVTRPGVSSIAGALAVELAISLIQHEDGINAPAYYKVGPQCDLSSEEENQGLLGIIPHSIRGFLSTFSHVLPATPKYNQCIACSEIVLKEYKEKGFEFLLQAFNSSKYLEDLTGLSALFNEDICAEVLELSDEDWET